jgi:hypothetical protein
MYAKHKILHKDVKVLYETFLGTVLAHIQRNTTTGRHGTSSHLRVTLGLTILDHISAIRVEFFVKKTKNKKL